MQTVQVKSVEATEVSRAILRRLHPGQANIPAGEAVQGVAEVLALAKVLEEIVDEAPRLGDKPDYRAVAATLLNRMRGVR